MSTFHAALQHKFAVGLNPAGAAEAAAAVPEPSDLVYVLGDAGVWGVSFHDDELAPPTATPAERDDVMDRLTKALDSTAVAVASVTANFVDHPVFAKGAFTSADRDVRRYAIQKAMRALDLGSELGAELLVLRGDREGTAGAAAGCPLDALGRYREAVDFLGGYVGEQGYGTRLALAARDGTVLPTTGHVLAFVATLAHGDAVGLSAEVGLRPAAVGGPNEVAQVIDAGKLFQISLAFGSAHPSEAFFLVKLLEDTGYAGPIHLAIDAGDAEDLGTVADLASAWMGTYRVLAAKARRFADDPDIRDALAECGAPGLAEPSVGPFSTEAGRALSTERFDEEAMSERGNRGVRLDQLVTDLVLGVR